MALNLDKLELTRNQVAVFERTEPDEPGYQGISRDTQASLLTPLFWVQYEDVVEQFIKDRELLEIRIPLGLDEPWNDLIAGWETRTPVHLNGFAERGTFLLQGEDPVLWVPENPTSALKIPIVGGKSSLARAVEAIFDAQVQLFKKTPPVKLDEINKATAAEDKAALRTLTLRMMAQGKTTPGMWYGDFLVGNAFAPVPATPLSPKVEDEWPEESKRLKEPNLGFRPLAVHTFHFNGDSIKP